MSEQIIDDKNKPALTEDQIKQQEADKIEAEFWEGLERKAAELTEKAPGKRKVFPFSLQGDNGEHIHGYVYDVDDATYNKIAWAKMLMMEKSIEIAKENLESLIWWDESHPEMRNRENMTGAALFLLGKVRVSMPEYKKK